MYDPATTQRYLHAQMQVTPSFKAEYHSISDCNAMVGLLAEAWDPDDHVYTRKLTDQEIDWIDNERLLCTHDAEYYYTRYARIIDVETRRLVPFKMNIAQRIVFDVWAEMESHQWAIMMLQLKARRLGVSTLSQIETGRRLQFLPETAALVASSTPAKSAGLVKIMRDSWDRMPWWLMPRVTKINDGVPVEFRDHNASLSVDAGNQFSGLGRGTTPSVVHLSEVCEWPNPAEDIDSSLLKAILEMHEIFFILESTALGRDNWYHKTWRLSKEGWPRGLAKLYPMFLPWYVGRDIYPTVAWLSKHPLPIDWSPDDALLRYAKRCEAFVKNHDRLRQYLGAGWVMPKEQLWYYEGDREEHRLKGELNRFLAEMCSDDFDAFQSTNYSAFNTEVIINCREQQRDPIGVYKLIGHGDAKEDIPASQRPSRLELDQSKPPIPIRCRWGHHELDYELIPVKYEGYDSATEGRVLIFEDPVEGVEYGEGVDTGDGLGLDGSVVEGIRKGDLIHNDAQVFECASPYINAMAFWPYAYALGTRYSTIINGQLHQARASIDCLKNGEIVQLEMRKRGWWNFHQWMKYDAKKLRLDKAHKLGFYSNNWARTMMLEMLLTYINNGWLDIASQKFIEEMESLEKDDVRQAMRANFGGHDDRIMAIGQILFSFHILEVRGPKIGLAEQRHALASAEDPEYDPGFQGRDMGNQVHPSMEHLLRQARYWDRDGFN